MNDNEKAKIILEELDNFININWNFEDIYIKCIKNGLRKIENLDTNNNG